MSYITLSISVLNVPFKRIFQVGEVGGQGRGCAAGAHHGREQGGHQGLQHVQLLRRLQVSRKELNIDAIAPGAGWLEEEV